MEKLSTSLCAPPPPPPPQLPQSLSLSLQSNKKGYNSQINLLILSINPIRRILDFNSKGEIFVDPFGAE